MVHDMGTLEQKRELSEKKESIVSTGDYLLKYITPADHIGIHPYTPLP
jgi:hypothetical protein